MAPLDPIWDEGQSSAATTRQTPAQRRTPARISHGGPVALSRVPDTQPETAPTRCSVAAPRAVCPHCHLHTVLCCSCELLPLSVPLATRCSESVSPVLPGTLFRSLETARRRTAEGVTWAALHRLLQLFFTGTQRLDQDSTSRMARCALLRCLSGRRLLLNEAG